MELAAEGEVARAMGMSWTERGPPGPNDGGPSEWRGQQWRKGTERWGNRGGVNQQWYQAVYFYKGRGCTYDEAAALAKGNGKGYRKPDGPAAAPSDATAYGSCSWGGC